MHSNVSRSCNNKILFNVCGCVFFLSPQEANFLNKLNANANSNAYSKYSIQMTESSVSHHSLAHLFRTSNKSKRRKQCIESKY